MIKITSWNVNSVKARLSHLITFLENESPDVLLLQELKCETTAFPYDALEHLPYKYYVNGQKTYNGVAVISKHPLEDVKINFDNNPDESQARFIECLVTINKKVIRVINVYVPNGAEVGADKFEYKLKFLDAFNDYIKNIKRDDEDLLIAGDFNIAPDDLSLYDVKIKGSICCSQQERNSFYGLLSHNLTDNFKCLNPYAKEFTWWDYRAGAFENNNGLRIDHILTSSQLTNSLKEVIIHKNERSKDKPSDHAPITSIFKF